MRHGNSIREDALEGAQLGRRARSLVDPHLKSYRLIGTDGLAFQRIRRLHVYEKNLVELLFRHFVRRPERIDSSIVDENVNMAISKFDRPLRHFTGASYVSKIGGYKICFACLGANCVDSFLPAHRVSPHNQDMNTKLSQL
jgi:hypothetical protein